MNLPQQRVFTITCCSVGPCLGGDFLLPSAILFGHRTASCPLSSTETTRDGQALRKGLVLLAGAGAVSASSGACLGSPPKGLWLFPDDLLDLLYVWLGNTSCCFSLLGEKEVETVFISVTNAGALFTSLLSRLKGPFLASGIGAAAPQSLPAAFLSFRMSCCIFWRERSCTSGIPQG